MSKTMMIAGAGLLAAMGGVSSAYAASGTYYLDFAPASPGPMVYPYSEGEKLAILGGLEAMYSLYPMSFTLTEPASGDYSTVTFNSGAIGTSSGIDFRNTDLNDFASINALMGIDFASSGYGPSSEEVVFASINLAGHEIGHLEGLRHYDAFGPIGSGFPSVGVTTGLSPAYPGPTDAFLTDSDVQSLTTASAGGFTLAKLVTASLSVGQRSAQKLIFNTDPNYWSESAIVTGPHDTPATATDLPMMPYAMPNLFPPGSPAEDIDFVAEMIEVLGDIDPIDATLSESDWYKFFGVAGSRVQIEVMSEIIDTSRIGVSEFDTAVGVWDPDDLAASIYYGTFTNNNELESTDSLILDFIVPETKVYAIEVFAADLKSTGDYALFVSQFRPVPEPTSFAMLGLGGLLVSLRRRG